MCCIRIRTPLAGQMRFPRWWRGSDPLKESGEGATQNLSIAGESVVVPQVCWFFAVPPVQPMLLVADAIRRSSEMR
jgi:hypothetical protein